MLPVAFSKMSNVIEGNAIFPFTRAHNKPGSGYMQPTDLHPNDYAFLTHSFYYGNFNPLFTDYEIHFTNGDLLGYKRLKRVLTLDDFLIENDFLCEWDFGIDTDTLNDKENTIASIKAIKSCSDCMETGAYKDGDACRECTLDFGENSDVYLKRLENEYCNSGNLDNEKRVTLCHTIATQVNPIVKDMDNLIDEISSSGYHTLVTKELNILVDSNNKLKEIIK
jgi:hypothetical protein